MNTNLLGVEDKVHRFMAEFCQTYSNVDQKMRSLIEDCFRRNVNNLQGFAFELKALVCSITIESRLLDIYRRVVGGGGPPPPAVIHPLGPGKRPGAPLDQDFVKRQCLQATRSTMRTTMSTFLPTINQWIRNGETDLIAKIFSLVGGYDKATDEQCIEICDLVIHLLESGNWGVFTSATPAETLTPFFLLLQADKIQVVWAASLVLVGFYDSPLHPLLQSNENCGPLLAMLEELLQLYFNPTQALNTPFLQKLAGNLDVINPLFNNLCTLFSICNKNGVGYDRFARIVEGLFSIRLLPVAEEVLAQVAITLSRLSHRLRDQYDGKPIDITSKCYTLLVPLLASNRVGLISASLKGLGALAWREDIWEIIRVDYMPTVTFWMTQPNVDIALSILGNSGFLAGVLETRRSFQDKKCFERLLQPLLHSLNDPSIKIAQGAAWVLYRMFKTKNIDPQSLSACKLFFSCLFEVMQKYVVLLQQLALRSTESSEFSSYGRELQETILIVGRTMEILTKHCGMNEVEAMCEYWLAFDGFPFSDELAIFFTSYLGRLFIGKAWEQYAASFQPKCLPILFKQLRSPASRLVYTAALTLKIYADNATIAKLILQQFDWNYALEALDASSDKFVENIILLTSKMIKAEGLICEGGRKFVDKCLDKFDAASHQVQLSIANLFNTSIRVSGWFVKDAHRVREKILKALQCEQSTPSLLFLEAAFDCLAKMMCVPRFRQSTDMEEVWPLVKAFLKVDEQESAVDFSKVREGVGVCVCSLLESCSEENFLQAMPTLINTKHPKFVQTSLYLLNKRVQISQNKDALIAVINREFSHFIVNQLGSSNEMISKSALYCVRDILSYKINQKSFFKDFYFSHVLTKVVKMLAANQDATKFVAMSALQAIAEMSLPLAEEVLEGVNRVGNAIGVRRDDSVEHLTAYSIVALVEHSGAVGLSLAATLCSLESVRKQLLLVAVAPAIAVIRKASKDLSTATSIGVHQAAFTVLKCFYPSVPNRECNLLNELGGCFLIDSEEPMIKERREAAIAFFADHLPQSGCKLSIEVLVEKINLLRTWLKTSNTAHPVETARLLAYFMNAGGIQLANPQLVADLLRSVQPDVGKEMLPVLEMLFKINPGVILPMLSRFENIQAVCLFPVSEVQERVRALIQAESALIDLWEEKALHAEGAEYQPLVLWLYPSFVTGSERLIAQMKKRLSVNFVRNALQLYSQLNLGANGLAAPLLLKSMPCLLEDDGKTFPEFYNNDSLKDFSVTVGEKSVRCHRIILAQYPYFQAALTNDPQVAAKGEIVLFEEQFPIVKLVVEYMYFKMLPVNSIQELLGCLQVARKFMMGDLELLCVAMLKSQLHPETFREIFDFASLVACEDLVEYAVDWAMLNYCHCSAELQLDIAAHLNEAEDP